MFDFQVLINKGIVISYISNLEKSETNTGKGTSVKQGNFTVLQKETFILSTTLLNNTNVDCRYL